MIRKLTPAPAAYDFGQLRTLTLARFPKAFDANVVDVGGTPNAAAYFNDGDAPGTATVSTWASEVAAHVPVPDPATANLATLQQRAAAALTANATYLAIASPTSAQNTAQIQRMTKECNALIRLALGLLNDISDTA